MTAEPAPRLRRRAAVVWALLSVAAVAPGQVAAEAWGGGPSEPIPDQKVCKSGIWVLKAETAPSKGGNRAFHLFGSPRNKTAVFPVVVEADSSIEVWVAGAPVSSKRLSVPSNQTTEIKFHLSKAANSNVKLTFFDEPSCSYSILASTK